MSKTSGHKNTDDLKAYYNNTLQDNRDMIKHHASSMQSLQGMDMSIMLPTVVPRKTMRVFTERKLCHCETYQHT